MGDYLDQFLLAKPILQRVIEVKPQLLWTMQSDQCRHGCETAVTLGESRAFPEITEERSVGQIGQLGAKSPIIFSAADGSLLTLAPTCGR